MSLHAFPAATATQPEALLCIHASAGTGRSWAPLVSPLANRFEIAMPDRLGYDREESWFSEKPASYAAEANHLAPLLCARPEGVHVIAHSYGAAVAIELALRWPHLVRSLTLYEPGRFALLFDDPAVADERNEIVRLGRTAGLWVMSGRARDAAAMFVDYWSGEGSWDRLDERKKTLIAGHMPKVAAEFEAAFADRTPPDRFGELTMPVHLMMGEHSPAPVRAIVGVLQSLLPDVQTVELTGVGHMGPVTHPSVVFKALPEWLRPVSLALAA